MKILKYRGGGDDIPNGRTFDKVTLGDFNLLVGQSASGKTRFLNTVFNAASFALGRFYSGSWEIEFFQENQKYRWEIRSKIEANKNIIEYEKLEYLSTNEILIKRDINEFIFQNSRIPKLSRDQSAIYLLREEEKIKPVFQAFRKVLRKNFFAGDAVYNHQINGDSPLYNKEFIESFERRQYDWDAVIAEPISFRTYILRNFYTDRFQRIRRCICDNFPFVTELDVIQKKMFIVSGSFPEKF